MRKGTLILIPIIVFATYMSRPLSAIEEARNPKSETRNEYDSKPEGEKVEIIVTPASPIQGEPVLVEVSGVGTSSIRALKFKNESMAVFERGARDGRAAGLIGLDLRMPPGEYPVTLTLTDGRVIQKNVKIGERKVVQAPLGIPEKLGGDTPEAEKELLETLAKEGKIINEIKTSQEQFWAGSFHYPLNGEITITDTYGYSRLTGASTIAHKGTDFRAKVGTPVYAINSGILRFTRNLRNYGNTVAIDHGTGVLSIYMHLSQIEVEEGEKVNKGDLIAYSGDTGYVLGPHLHLTIRINNISIDPMKFYELGL